MRTPAIIAALALAWIGVANAQTLYRPAEGDFTVAFLAQPQIRTIAPTRTRPSFRLYGERGKVGSRLVEVTHATFTGPKPNPDEAFYQNMIDQFAKGGDFQVQSSHWSSLSGHPAMAAVFTGTAKGEHYTGEVRCLWLGDSGYVLSYVEKGDRPMPDAGAAFFESFHLTAQ